MIEFRPGSRVYKLFSVLSYVGEFPVYSLNLLGEKHGLRMVVSELTEVCEIRNSKTGEVLKTRLVNICGKGAQKTIRIHKGALPILNWIHPNAYEYYMSSFWNHRFPGDKAHKNRNHRVAEAVALCASSGIETVPYLLPPLQMRSIQRVVPPKACMYLSRDIKKINPQEQNKTMFTRNVGEIFYPGGCYAAYNARNAAMVWSGMGEFKALHSMIETARMNSGIQKIDSAILFGKTEAIALKTLQDSDKTKRSELRFDSIYRHIHFIPLNEFGARRLKMLVLPDWNRKLLDALFDPKTRSYNKGILEYDAFIDGVYVFSFLDGDLARLLRFREAVDSQTGKFEVLCFPEQVPFVKKYLGSQVRINTIKMGMVEQALGLEG